MMVKLVKRRTQEPWFVEYIRFARLARQVLPGFDQTRIYCRNRVEHRTIFRRRQGFAEPVGPDIPALQLL